RLRTATNRTGRRVRTTPTATTTRTSCQPGRKYRAARQMVTIATCAEKTPSARAWMSQYWWTKRRKTQRTNRRRMRESLTPTAARGDGRCQTSAARAYRPDGSGRKHGLDLEGDVHRVADEELAAVERDVEVHTELLAGDLGRRLEADALAAPRVGLDAEVLDVELDRLGDALDRQLAGRLLAVEAGRDEGHRAVVLHVEKVGRAEVAVALGVAGVDRVQVDGGVGGGVGQSRTRGEGALELLELAADLRHQVANGEADLGVARVDGPGTGDQVRHDVLLVVSVSTLFRPYGLVVKLSTNVG